MNAKDMHDSRGPGVSSPARTTGGVLSAVRSRGSSCREHDGIAPLPVCPVEMIGGMDARRHRLLNGKTAHRRAAVVPSLCRTLVLSRRASAQIDQAAHAHLAGKLLHAVEGGREDAAEEPALVELGDPCPPAFGARAQPIKIRRQVARDRGLTFTHQLARGFQTTRDSPRPA